MGPGAVTFLALVGTLASAQAIAAPEEERAARTEVTAEDTALLAEARAAIAAAQNASDMADPGLARQHARSALELLRGIEGTDRPGVLEVVARLRRLSFAMRLLDVQLAASELRARRPGERTRPAGARP